MFKVVNLADASRNGKIAPELLRAVQGEGKAELTGYDEKKFAEVSALVAKGSIDHTNKYIIQPADPLRMAVQQFRREAGTGHAFIVLDNLERIFDKPHLMEELADLITLADDAEFLQSKVRFLLVGVPTGVKEYFANTPSHRTVANRLIELVPDRKVHDLKPAAAPPGLFRPRRCCRSWGCCRFSEIAIELPQF